MSSEKISSTELQGPWKEQKRNPVVYQTHCKKGNADDYHAIEREKSNPRCLILETPNCYKKGLLILKPNVIL